MLPDTELRIKQADPPSDDVAPPFRRPAPLRLPAWAKCENTPCWQLTWESKGLDSVWLVSFQKSI